MAPHFVRCALGNHFIRGRGVTMTNPKHISFIKKVRPTYQPQQEMCPQCKVLIERIYRMKMDRKRRRILQSSISVSSLSTSASDTSSDNDRPTTSKRAAARKSPSSTTTDDETPINIRRGIRLPNIQPAVKRRVFVHTNPDVMNLYLQGLIGG